MSWVRLGLPLALLYLCSQSACGHHSDHLCMRRSFWKELMRGLENMNPVLSLECRTEYDESLQLPAILKPAKPERAAAAVEILKGLQNLFGESDALLPQNELRIFLNSASEVLSQLRSCVKSRHSQYIYQLDVQERFRKLKAFIKQKGNNSCAWEIVHAITREILQESAINHARK